MDFFITDNWNAFCSKANHNGNTILATVSHSVGLAKIYSLLFIISESAQLALYKLVWNEAFSECFEPPHLLYN